MLHCWQPKHKYNLNGCQMGKSRGEKKALCQDLQPWKRTGSAWVAGKRLAPLLTSLLGQRFGKKEKEKLFSGCLELWRGSWEGIWVGLGVSGVLQALGKAHFRKWRGKKGVKFQLWWQDWWFLGWLEHCSLLPSFLP